MPAYLYRGFNENRQSSSGYIKFSNKQKVEEFLKKEKISDYEIYNTKTTLNFVNPKELSIFCRQMSVVFISDITIMEGILLLSEQTTDKQLKIALEEIYKFMENGMTLYEALSMYTNVFSSYFINMIKIGETSGTLDIVFNKMSDYYEKESKIIRKVKSATIYPVILIIMMTAIVVLLIVKILPMFNEILITMGGKMPAITQAILGLSGFLYNYGVLIISILLLVFCLIYLFGKTKKGVYFYDKLKIKIPFIKEIHLKIVVSRFARSLSILLKSGIQILYALDTVSVLMENKYLENKLQKTIKEVEEGADFAEALKNVDIFPPLFLKMIIIGEKTGRVDDMLEKSASVFDEDVDDYLEKFSNLIEPVLVIILSVVVGIILISVMLPMISIMTNIG